MSLPPLPTGNGKSDKRENFEKPASKSFQSLPGLPVFPDLPDLDDLEPLDLTGESIDDDTQPETYESEEVDQDDSKDELYEDFEDGEPVSEDFENLPEEDGFENVPESSDFEELSDDDDGPEEEFSFLPTVNYEDEEEDPEEEEKKPPVKKITKNKTGKGFKELDDDSVKEFLDKIKSKLMGLLQKKDKANEGQPKPTEKKDAEEKDKKSLGKINGKKGAKKPKKKLDSKKSLALVATLSISAIVILLIFVLGNGYQPLNKLTVEAKGETTNVLLQNFKKENGIIKLNIVNQGDISADFLMEAEFTEKSLLPFNKNVVSCQSDIIAVESGGQVDELLGCENLNEELEYKVDIEIIDL